MTFPWFLQESFRKYRKFWWRIHCYRWRVKIMYKIYMWTTLITNIHETQKAGQVTLEIKNHLQLFKRLCVKYEAWYILIEKEISLQYCWKTKWSFFLLHNTENVYMYNTILYMHIPTMCISGVSMYLCCFSISVKYSFIP